MAKLSLSLSLVIGAMTNVACFPTGHLAFSGSGMMPRCANQYFNERQIQMEICDQRFMNCCGSNLILSRPRARHHLAGSKSHINEGDQEEEGKFHQLGREITDAFGPLGLITAGYEEEHLDLVIDASEAAIAQYCTKVEQEEELASVPVPHLPVAILGKSDLSLTFGEILSQLKERDCVLPADGDELLVLRKTEDTRGGKRSGRSFNYLKYPLVLFSGFEIPALQLSIRFIESLGERLPMQPMIAMAVPKAMDKPVSQLLEELEGDHVGVMEDQQQRR